MWLKNDWNRTEQQARVFDALRASHLATVRATHSRIAPLIKAAKTIKAHWAGVLRWFTSRISNGAVEAINGLIQLAKRKARGFRSSAYLMTMIYLIAGKLDFKLPALAHVTHTK